VTISAYPLAWPDGWRRTHAHYRRPGHFHKRERRPGESWARSVDLTVAESIRRVLAELERMGVTRDDVVISTNLRTRLDGLPRSDQPAPEDPGAAVYWQEVIGPPRCIAVDQYTKVEDNLAAIAATLDAMRAIERHGGAAILERAFTGFTALPPPDAKREWWEVLGVSRDCTREQVKAAYRRLASQYHPDKPGGSHERMAQINAAQDAGLQERFT
jgi:hypothetical protein